MGYLDLLAIKKILEEKGLYKEGMYRYDPLYLLYRHGHVTLTISENDYKSNKRKRSKAFSEIAKCFKEYGFRTERNRYFDYDNNFNKIGSCTTVTIYMEVA